ncbi:unnamed protein product, partial [Coffea canephora]
MADALLGSTVQVLVEKAINMASEQIGLFVGFKNNLEKLMYGLTLIKPVLHDAEEKQVTQEFVKRWLEKLEAVAFDAGNLLDDINYEMIRRRVEIQNQMNKKVCFFFFSLSSPIAFRCNLMANKIQQINMDLNRINEGAMNFSLQSQIGARDVPALSPPSGEGFVKNSEIDSVTIDTSFIGRGDDVSAIVTQLTATSSNETLSVLPLVGMGGIGKTTLARKVFNELKIDIHFDKKNMGLCCFAYCTIYSKDFQMERSQLIRLWMAEGFLHSNQRNNMRMEEVGNMYFMILLDSNLFQDAEKDDYGNVLNCKMHDLVHDMVQ